jgi:predicted acylesterase/phospholipase RssA/CRP-like cAMP-binding protein
MPENADLRQSPILRDLSDTDWEAVAPLLNVREYEQGAVIVNQGELGVNFHILIFGMAERHREQGGAVRVAKLDPGSNVGAMPCLTGGAMDATVVAESAARTVAMGREGLLMLMDKSASFRREMIEAMVRRINESNDKVVEEYTRSFAVMRQLETERQARFGDLVGDSRFMRQLRVEITVQALQEGPLCLIGEKGVGKSHVAAEVHAASRRAEYPLLTVDAGEGGVGDILEQWEFQARAAKGGTIVLEQADLLPPDLLYRLLRPLTDTRVILTVQQKPDIPPELKVYELELAPLRERQDDIPLLAHAFLAEAGVPHPGDILSQEALHMIAAFPYLAGNVREMKRVVQDALLLSGGRIIRTSHLRFGSAREPGSRPKIGVALGSGSVRGAAHVGVLKVMEQVDIPVDIIAGTSVGAFIGALYAGGQPISAFERVLPTVLWRQLVKPTLPPRAFVDNNPMARFVEKYIGPIHFEDLPISFAAVASDAVSGEAYVLNKGRVSHAICASTAIPGFMRPVNYHNRVLVDGAVVHPVPVALAKSMGADIVIAVDLSTPARAEPKHFVASILNTIDIMSAKILNDELQLADVVLNPQLGTNQVTFKASAAFIEVGEQAAREAVTTIKRKIAGSMGRLG